MNNENYTIRLEKPNDYREVENLVRDSFWNVYRPGCYEHFTLKKLRENSDFVPELDFVMEQNGKIIGQNVFVKAVITADNGNKIPILTMGPICIANKYKRMGYGKKLLDYSLLKASQLGYGAVFIEGNIDFYGKSGFNFARNYSIRYHGLPEGIDDSFFICKVLKEGYLDDVTGEYSTPSVYFACEQFPKEFEEYEKTFPYKEKLKLPGQIE